jgi:hypothetical protein
LASVGRGWSSAVVQPSHVCDRECDIGDTPMSQPRSADPIAL